MSKKTIGIMIVDDHAMVSSGLRLIIENEHDMKVVGEAGTGGAAIEMAAKLNPDIIIMDIALPDMNGVEATERILGICPSTRVIALTMYPEEAYLEAFIKAGGLGYVPKSAADRNLITTIRSVAAGEFVLGQNGVQIITRKFQELSRRHSSFEPLSKRESEVLALTVKGNTSKEIGEKLFLSPRTVETYRLRIMTKLGLKHRSELFDFAYRNNIL